MIALRTQIEYSVVIPFYNEASNVTALVDDLIPVMRGLSGGHEVILIDDGSTDATGALLDRLSVAYPECQAVSLPRNLGQAGALYVGLNRARGRLIITMDGDRQNSPADIPKLLAWIGAADMVVGIRQHRRDGRVRRWMSRGANAIRGRVLRDGMRDSGCALKLFRREIVDALIPIRTLYSFMPAMATAAGFKVTQMPVRHLARAGGSSNYGVRAFLWRPLVDMLGMWWYTRRCVRLATPRQSQARMGAA